jgi:prolyl-tRNA editing enzyme YbaK/EbsC (Cys-tRNA(Pro) deacylase)
MLEHVVEYLRSRGVPFRLSSRPAPEAHPAVSEPLQPGTVAVETRVVLIEGVPALVCIPREGKVNLLRLSHELGTEVVDGTTADFTQRFGDVTGPIPPLGGAFGALVVVDEQITAAPAIAFEAFASSDHIEIPYDKFAMLEQPKVVSFVTGGELPKRQEDS